ncbi:Hyccin [Dillenia turbinata]|uniref:Hyccin n=1 Tax=Dillenia turbinata TaxID=194707 RepID=A0AAN8ZFL9_9MAGN
MLSDTSPESSTASASSGLDSYAKGQIAINSLSIIITTVPNSVSASENPSYSLLHDPEIASQVSSLLRDPNSGAGDNNLCRWLYDTFQSSDPNLQLVVLRYLPIIAGVYLSRVALRRPLAGFEAVLLALYAHETTSRAGQSWTVSVPDLSHPSLYHESRSSTKSNATEQNIAVVSPRLEPYGTVRSTKRARIVGVALELYYSKIIYMPVRSKIEFCEFCETWAGQDGEMYKDGEEVDKGMQQLRIDDAAGSESVEKERDGEKVGRIPLPWELLQPVLRILGHCLLGTGKDKDLFDAACRACRSLYARSLHDINSKAILATGSLLRLAKMSSDSADDFEPPEILNNNAITL